MLIFVLQFKFCVNERDTYLLYFNSFHDIHESCFSTGKAAIADK
jgi:hypothetical protein